MGTPLGIACISSVFGGLAGLCAFLIAYQEYEHHFTDSHKTWRMALEFGIVAFIFFWVVAFVLLSFLPGVLRIP